MKNCVIFGCGKIGAMAYYKLKDYYNVIAWADNNPKLWGTRIHNIIVLEPEKLKDHTFEDMDCFVCMAKPSEVVSQLESYDLRRIYVFKGGFIFMVDNMSPLTLFEMKSYISCKNDQKLKVLFVADSANIRDHKMARGVRNAGHHVYMAYIKDDPRIVSAEYVSMYEKIFPVSTIDELLRFIDSSDFDIIHSSSEPDYLTPILLRTNKTVIHDCHDLRSSNRPVTPEMLMIEYLAHKEADGILYPTAELRDEAIRKYNIPVEKTFVIENYISEDLITKERISKRSFADGRIHCVYEGGLAFDDQSYKYCHYNTWKKLADAGLIIHFYTGADPEKCRSLAAQHRNIYYEGNCSSKKLAIELSQYDVGLCLYNITPVNRHYMECASPNKLFEYINAGLPVAVSDIARMTDFVEKYKVGNVLDQEGDLVQQMNEIKSIKIEEGFLRNNNMIFENMMPGLMDFYRRCMKR